MWHKDISQSHLMAGWKTHVTRLAEAGLVAVVRLVPSAAASTCGAAAVEFALVVPILAAIVVGASQVTDVVVGSSHMETAARASIQYALNGGSDMTAAQSVGMQAWQSPPANATLVASDYCSCDGVVSVCTQTCSDGSTPYQYVSVKTSGFVGGAIYNLNKSVTQTARIR